MKYLTIKTQVIDLLVSNAILGTSTFNPTAPIGGGDKVGDDPDPEDVAG